MARNLFIVALLFAALCCAAMTAYAAEDPKAARERLCGSNTDCLTVLVVDEVPDDGVASQVEPEVLAAIQTMEEKGGNKKKKMKRVTRSFLKIDKLDFKKDTVVKVVQNMPEWFGPRPSKFFFRGKEVPISKRLSRFNPRLNEKLVMMKADENDDAEFVVPKEEGGSFDL